MSDKGNPNWKKGGPSPNPTGRPKANYTIAELARGYTHMAISTLAEIAEKGESESARVSAAIHLLDRGWDRCRQPVDVLTLYKKISELSSAELAELEQRLIGLHEEPPEDQFSAPEALQ